MHLLSSHSPPSLPPLLHLCALIIFIPSFQAMTLDLIPYLILPPSPYLYDIHPEIVLAAYESAPNSTTIREYC